MCCSSHVGNAIKNVPRDKVVIASKWAAMKGEAGITCDTSPANCRSSLEGALRRIGVDYIDLYIMRGWDHKTPLEDSIKAMAVSLREMCHFSLVQHFVHCSFIMYPFVNLQQRQVQIFSQGHTVATSCLHMMLLCNVTSVTSYSGPV